MDIQGYPVVLADTAGLRQATEEVEQEGVRRAVSRAEAADLRIVVTDATGEVIDPAVAELARADALVVVNKCDLRPAPETAAGGALPISVKTGFGLERFIARLEQEVARRMALTAAPALTRERHRRALEDCARALERAGGGLSNAALAELVAEDLRLAVRSLGRITGKVDVEDVLDVIFGEFCIGK
jgi:tRNA modification GTPase